MWVLESPELSVEFSAISQLSVKISAHSSAIRKLCRPQISFISLKMHYFSADSENFDQSSAIGLSPFQTGRTDSGHFFLTKSPHANLTPLIWTLNSASRE